MLRAAASRRLALALLALVSGCPGARPSPRTQDRRTVATATLEAQVTALMRQERVVGLALAIIDDGQVRYLRAFGERDREQRLPLTSDSVMYAASLTKATFAWLVLQLVDEGRLDLDRPLPALLSRPLPEHPRYADLAGDERWRLLTPRMLLSHTSGFANFRGLEPDHKLRFHRQPGARYGYSNEGINLLQLALEEGLGIDVAAEMQRRIFDRFGMTRTSLTWRADAAADLAQGYGEDGALVPHEQRRSVRAAGSMDTTPADWARFLAAVSRGEGLSAAARAELLRRQVSIDSVTEFPTLREERTTAWASIGLGYGLGWGVFESRQGHAFFKEGHDDGTANFALCIEPQRRCVLLMSNSVRAERIFPALVELVLGPLDAPWSWYGYGRR